MFESLVEEVGRLLRLKLEIFTRVVFREFILQTMAERWV